MLALQSRVKRDLRFLKSRCTSDEAGLLIKSLELGLADRARRGSINAHCHFCNVHAFGLGKTQKNHTTVMQCFTVAAEKGSAYAQYSLGWLLETRDSVKADKLFVQAAEQEMARSQLFLARVWGGGIL